MSRLLSIGESEFLLFKIGTGAFAAFVLYRAAHLPLAQRGMRLVLAIYVALMLVHLATGFTALGWQAPSTVLAYFASLSHTILAILR